MVAFHKLMDNTILCGSKHDRAIYEALWEKKEGLLSLDLKSQYVISGKDHLKPINTTKIQTHRNSASDLWQHLVQPHFIDENIDV